MSIMATLFGETQHLTVAQECARAVLILGYGLVLVRVAGRRVFGKWTAIDIVVSIVIGSNLSRALTGNAPLLGTLAASALLMGLHALLALGAARWPAVSRLLEGRAVELRGRDGLSHRMRIWHGVSEAAIDEALREKGLTHAGEAQAITLEPSGKITVQR